MKTPNTTETVLSAPSKRQFSRKSTATEAQYQQIDRMFDHVGKLITTLDFRGAGIMHPSGRIKEMNERLGYYIPTVDQRTVTDEQGFAHPRIAFYELIDRPMQAMPCKQSRPRCSQTMPGTWLHWWDCWTLPNST
jgi:hypothetical protein